jgi:hypothetical protein
MPKRHYVVALACYLLIPVVLIAGARLFLLIDPEMARFRDTANSLEMSYGKE